MSCLLRSSCLVARSRKLIAANPNHFGTVQDKGTPSCSRRSRRSSRTRATRRSAVSRTAPSSTGWRRRSSSSGLRVQRRAVRHRFGRARPVLRRLRLRLGRRRGGRHPRSTTCRSRQGLRRRPRPPVRPRRRGRPVTPLRKFCASPVLPRVRAILSWQHEPTAGDPGYIPVWGEVQEDTSRSGLVAGSSRSTSSTCSSRCSRSTRRDRGSRGSRPAAGADPRARTRSARWRSTRSRCRPIPDPTRCRSAWSGSAGSTQPTS